MVSKITDILDKYALWVDRDGDPRANGLSQSEAEHLILAVFEDAIGADEIKPKDYNPNNRYKLAIDDRNELRAEIRQKLGIPTKEQL